MLYYYNYNYYYYDSFHNISDMEFLIIWTGFFNWGEKMPLNGQRKAWAIFFTLIILAAFVIPFVSMSELMTFYGAFLFWVVFAIVAIIGIGIITSRWRDD